MHLSDELQQLFAAPGPAELSPQPRPGTRSVADITRAVESARLSAARGELIRATLLLWHDHLEAAHQIAQGAENRDGSYVHAILHRREPDYGNAKYWFRRVGRHTCFAALATRAGELLEAQRGSACAECIVRGVWDPFAFVDSCETAARMGAEAPFRPLLRRIQQIEFEVLLEHFWSS